MARGRGGGRGGRWEGGQWLGVGSGGWVGRGGGGGLLLDLFKASLSPERYWRKGS